MKNIILLSTAIVLAGACVLGVLGEESLAQHDSVEARAAAILLRNGEVLEGRVSVEGDYYALILAHGELRIRREQVAAIEPSVEVLYREHVYAKAAEGLDGHIERADWCLRHDLLGYAASEITQAAQLAPTAQRVVALRQRLETVRRPAVVKPVPVEPQPEPEFAHTPQEAVDSNALETFTVSIQPLLLNRCANATCHGHASSSEFRLQRGIDGRPIPRSLTLANLTATLRYVDRARPTLSTLLTTPIRPHAKAKDAVFLQQHHKQYDLLVRWVEQLATETKAAPIATSGTGQTRQQPQGINTNIETLSRPLNEPRSDKPTQPTPRPASADSQPAASQRDPYDPAEFNRRFFKERAAEK